MINGMRHELSVHGPDELWADFTVEGWCPAESVREARDYFNNPVDLDVS